MFKKVCILLTLLCSIAFADIPKIVKFYIFKHTHYMILKQN